MAVPVPERTWEPGREAALFQPRWAEHNARRGAASNEPLDPLQRDAVKPAPPRVAVVIPCFRARDHVARVIARLPAFVSSIIVVDDACPDRSGDAVAALGDPRVTLLRHTENQGVGGATWTGIKHAHHAGAEVIVKMDADDQMDPDQLPALVAPILEGEADYTKGNRFLHARELGGMPALRRLGNLGLSFLTKVASGYWNVFDPTNGYTALHASLVPLLEPRNLHRRYFFETSLLLELGMLRAVVRDVAMPARYGDEVSNLSATRALLSFPPRQVRGFLRRVWVQHFVRDFGLTALFALAGLGLTTFGGVFGAYHWWQSYTTNTPAPMGTIMLSVLPVIIGVQCLLQASLFDVQAQPSEPLQHQLRRRAALRDVLEPRPTADTAARLPRPAGTREEHPQA